MLDRALQSVLGQDFQDWTLVVVNDGGPAAAVDAILERHADRLAGRANVLHNPHSRGMEAASNQGIRSCSSEFVAVHDDDDEWAPEFLTETVAYLDSHSDGGVTVETEIVFERLTAAGREVQERLTFEPQLQAITLIDLLHFNRFVPISFLFRRSVYDALGGFDEDLAVVGDWEFHLRFVIESEIGYLKGKTLAFWNQRRGAAGAEANSVIAGADDHKVYSLMVRDRLLRKHAQKHGLGPLLYERELIGVEVLRLHEHLDRIQEQLKALESAVVRSTPSGKTALRRLVHVARRASTRIRGG